MMQYTRFQLFEFKSTPTDDLTQNMVLNMLFKVRVSPSMQPIVSCSCVSKPNSFPAMSGWHVVAILFTNFNVFLIIIEVQTDEYFVK